MTNANDQITLPGICPSPKLRIEVAPNLGKDSRVELWSVTGPPKPVTSLMRPSRVLNAVLSSSPATHAAFDKEDAHNPQGKSRQEALVCSFRAKLQGQAEPVNAVRTGSFVIKQRAQKHSGPILRFPDRLGAPSSVSHIRTKRGVCTQLASIVSSSLSVLRGQEFAIGAGYCLLDVAQLARSARDRGSYDHA